MEGERRGRGTSWLTVLLPALVAGLGLRLWYLADLVRRPFFDFPIVDSLTYDRLARAILSGPVEGAFTRPPLYPQFLALTYTLGGQGQLPVVLAHFALGLVAVVPLYFLARCWFSATTAALAAWICALYPLRIFFEGEVLAVTLFSFLLLWGVWFFWSGLERSSALRFVLAGLLFGLGTLARPNFLLVLPFLAAGGIAALRPRKPAALPGMAWMAAALVLTLLPATLHNWRAEGALIPVSVNGGVNFYLGNLPGSTGETPLPPGLQWQDTVQEPLRLGKTTLAGQDRYWRGRALKAIGEDPAGWLLLVGRKAALFWTAQESSNNKDLAYFTAYAPAVRYYRYWFGVLACLAFASLFFLPLRPGKLLLAALIVGYWVAVTLFFITARYRLPLVPFLGLLAASAVTEAARRIWDGKAVSTLLPLLATALAAAAIFPGWLSKGENGIDPNFQMGQVYLGRGDPGRAEIYLRRAERRNPSSPDVYNSLAAARFDGGNLQGAEDLYLRALAYGNYSEVYFNLGVVYEKMGPSRRLAAKAAYRRALEINPLDARARANLHYLEKGADEEVSP